MRRIFTRLLMTLISLMLFPTLTFADNPVIKNRFTADPAALVHNDTIYLYTGHDEVSPHETFFVLKEWNVFSSTDGSN